MPFSADLLSRFGPKNCGQSSPDLRVARFGGNVSGVALLRAKGSSETAYSHVASTHNVNKLIVFRSNTDISSQFAAQAAEKERLRREKPEETADFSDDDTEDDLSPEVQAEVAAIMAYKKK